MTGKDETRTETIAVRVTPTLYKLLERYAQAHDQTMSAAVGDVLQEAQRFLEGLTRLAEANKKKKQAAMERAFRAAPKPR